MYRLTIIGQKNVEKNIQNFPSCFITITETLRTKVYKIRDGIQNASNNGASNMKVISTVTCALLVLVHHYAYGEVSTGCEFVLGALFEKFTNTVSAEVLILSPGPVLGICSI
jgi:hypothetical protein